MAKPGNTGIKRIFNAFFYSMAGLKAAWQNEAAIRQEMVLLIVLGPVALWLGDDALSRALLLGSLLLVLIVELINSALEAVVDRISDEHHELSGRAKDIGSAAVLVALLNVLVIWGLFITEKFCPQL